MPLNVHRRLRLHRRHQRGHRLRRRHLCHHRRLRTSRRLCIRVHVFLSEHRAENLHLIVDNSTSQRQDPRIFREVLKSRVSRVNGEPKNRASIAGWKEHCDAIADRLAEQHTSYRALHRLFQVCRVGKSS